MEPDEIAAAITYAFNSPNVIDSNFEHANLVDVVNFAANNLNRVAKAITADGIPYTDPCGIQVSSLTEAVVLLARKVEDVADAIQQLARETNP